MTPILLLASASVVCLLPVAVLARRIRWHAVGQGWDAADGQMAQEAVWLATALLWLAMAGAL